MKKFASTCLLLVVEKPQINYPMSRNPWEVIISGPVHTRVALVGPPAFLALFVFVSGETWGRGRQEQRGGANATLKVDGSALEERKSGASSSC